MKRNPICKKEMRSAVRDVKIPVTITICSSILAAVALLSMYLNVAQVRVSAQIQYRSFLDLYVFVAVIGFLMLVFLMPALTAGSISGERERQTLDIMMTTMVSRWDIVSGKLLSSLAVMFLVIISMFPVLALAFVYGGISWLDVGILMICFFTSALLTGAIGIFCSALFKRSIISTVVAYSLTALLSLGNFLIFFFGMRSMRRYNPKEIYRRKVYTKSVKQGQKSAATHRCAVCGRTEKDGDDLVFRFCSKCNGNYEYCQDHLFTHEHVK